MGKKGLDSYIAIMQTLEQMLASIDYEGLLKRALEATKTAQESEKRFYFVETRVKLVEQMLKAKVEKLEKEKDQLLRSS